MMSLVIVGLYVIPMLFLLGVFLGDEMAYKNPEYGLATVAAVVWPVTMLFAGYHWVNQR